MKESRQHEDDIAWKTEGSPGFRAFLSDGLLVLGLRLDPGRVALLDRFRALVAEADRVCNLTALESSFEVAVKHFIDSLTCLETGLFDGPVNVVDIGSGAGFPGIPLKIARPDIRLTLLEAVGKRAAFLARAVDALGLEGCRVVRLRAERFGWDATGRGCYDVGVVRAVARLATDLEYGVPLLKVGGRLVVMKGPRVDEEAAAGEAAAAELGAALVRRLDLALPLSGERRTLLVFEKTSSTPDRYPRREGVPSRRPLGAPAAVAGVGRGAENR